MSQTNRGQQMLKVVIENLGFLGVSVLFVVVVRSLRHV